MTAFETIRFIAGGVLLLAGAFVMVTAVVGNFKFRYVLSRMHAAGLGDTLGIALILAGCAVIRWSLIFTLKEALVVALLWVTSPAASHMIMKMELENGSSADGKKEGRKK